MIVVYLWHRVGSAILIFDKLCFHSLFDDPVATLSGISFRSLLFRKGFVQGQVVSDAVVPALFGVFAVESESA